MIRSSVVFPDPDGPEQRHQLAVGHVEADVVQCREAPERLGDVEYLYAHVQCPASASRRRRPMFHSTTLLATSVTTASSINSDATANAAAKSYSL